MEFRKALWVGPVLLIPHNLEEFLTMGQAVRAHLGQVPAPLARLLATMLNEQFAVPLLLVTVAAFLVVYFASRDRVGGGALTLALGVQGMMVANAAQHTATALFLRGYAPGVVTALALVLPYGLYIIRRAIREGYITLRRLVWVTVACTVGTVPLVVGLHYLGQLV